MYRLLIVDDEHYIADELETLFLTQSQMELEVYKAYLAKDALEIMREVKIDVLLSDIKMPEIDGFGLADRVKQEWPEAKIIFLTAYNEFDLAYRTQKYEDITMVLKMEEESVIIDTVLKAVHKIEQERAERIVKKTAEDLNAIFTNSMEMGILRETVESGGKNISNYTGNLDVGSDISFCMMGFKHHQKEDSAYMDRERYAYRLSQCINGVLSPVANCGVMRYKADNYLILIQAKEDSYKDRLLSYLKMMGDEIIESLEDRLDDDFILMIFDWEMKIKDIHNLQEFVKSSELSDMGNACRIVTREEWIKYTNGSGELLWKDNFGGLIENIRDYLEKGNRGGIQHHLRIIKTEAVKVHNKHFYPLIVIYQNIASLFLEYLNSRGLIEKVSFKMGVYKLFSISEFDNWGEAFDYLSMVVDQIFELDGEEKHNSENEFVAFVRNYVEQNLSKNLSLTELSKAMNYNPSYVSRTFKKIYGKNFVDYVTQVKLEKAKNLLMTTDYSIQRIAFECGFVSRQYFSTVFRKKYGITPNDYKNSV